MMKKAYLPLTLIAILPLLLYACDSANPVAPNGTVLTITASPTTIGLNESSIITVTGFRPDGNPLNPGTQVTLTTTIGVVSPTTLMIGETGTGTAVLRGDGRTGSTTVTAATPGSDATATVDVQIGEDMTTQPVLNITANPTSVSPNSTAEVTVIVRNADGSLFGAGADVEFRTSLGTIDSLVRTDTNSRAVANFNAGNLPGTATVTASFGASAEATVDITIQEISLSIFANPNIVPVLGQAEITVIARDAAGLPLGGGERIRLIAELGTIQSEVFTDSNGEATALFTAGDRAGTAEVTALLGTSAEATVSIAIRDAPAFIDLTAPDLTVDATGGTLDLSALVQNAQGEPLSSILVVFESPDVGGTFSNTNQVTTNTLGVAANMLTVEENDFNTLPAGTNTFTIRATARGEGAEVTDTITITIN